MRLVLAVIAGFALWSVLWVGAHQGAVSVAPQLYDSAGIPTSPAIYAAYLAFSVVCSLLAGRIARVVAARGSFAVLVLALVLLAVGVAVQASAWSQQPLWYHLAFLALLVPACLIGGRAHARPT
jgi:MFS family permease